MTSDEASQARDMLGTIQAWFVHSTMLARAAYKHTNMQLKRTMSASMFERYLVGLGLGV